MSVHRSQCKPLGHCNLQAPIFTSLMPSGRPFFIRVSGSLLPRKERKAYKQSVLEEALTWNKLLVYLPAQLDWIIRTQASRTDPLLHYYKISKFGQPQEYVQWNSLRPRDLTMTKSFERRIGCHNFEDFTSLYGNSEAFEAQRKQKQDFSFIARISLGTRKHLRLNGNKNKISASSPQEAYRRVWQFGSISGSTERKQDSSFIA